MKYAGLLPLFVASVAAAQEPPCDGKCLSKDRIEKLLRAIDELDDIHKSAARIEFIDPIVIIRDWDGKIYVNGGTGKPIRLKIKIGRYVDRDMLTTVDSRVWYRPQPEPPMFRLRIRAQAGILIPELVRGMTFWDAGVGWDFFHIGAFNVSAFTGVMSSGIGPGIDITKNFGVYAGYSFMYDGMRSSAFASAYFSFD